MLEPVSILLNLFTTPFAAVEEDEKDGALGFAVEGLLTSELFANLSTRLFHLWSV